MRESKNLDASMVPKKYPNIAKIFTKEWFKSEFRKEKKVGDVKSGGDNHLS